MRTFSSTHNRRQIPVLTGHIAAFVVTLLLGATVALPPRAGAVIFYATGDPEYNTTAPTGSLANSGWQWQGAWGGFSGTAIGPRHFIAAKHAGGTVGDALVLSGTSYTTTAFVDDPSCDLRIWEISGTFPSWAPLYRGSNETGKGLVVFGRGVSRGGEVGVGGVLKGWGWGGGSGTMRWGENAVAKIANGGINYGELLQATFDANGGPNEAHVGVGDSSGALFINDGGAWKLAGINLSVDGPFYYTPTPGTGFNASIFDARGLYYVVGKDAQGDDIFSLIGGPSAVPSSFYATRISAHTVWIDSNVPPPVAAAVNAPLLDPVAWTILAAGLGAAGVIGARRRHRVECSDQLSRG